MSDVLLIPIKELTQQQDRILKAVIASIPYPEHISNVECSEDDVIYLKWRGIDFRIHLLVCPTAASVEESRGASLFGSNLAILFRELLNGPNGLGRKA